MIFERISSDDALNFLKENYANREVVFIRNHDVWFGVKNKDILIAVCAVDLKRNHVEIAGTFVLHEMRNKGICTNMYKNILKVYPDQTIVGYFRPISAHIVSKMGFIEKASYSNGTKKMSRSKNGKTEN